MNAKEVRTLRKKLEMTQEEFARKIGVAHFTVVRWENEMNKPSRLAISKLEQLEVHTGATK